MSEIWNASDPNREGEQSWKWRDSPMTLRWWWGLFLAMNVCGTILTFVARNKSGEVIPRLIGQSYLGIVKDLIGIPAALVTILVIQSVNGQQAAGLARLRNSEMRCTSPNL